jgi:protein-S-isoprenylcysteine O-methyltransferase Ste14
MNPVLTKVVYGLLFVIFVGIRRSAGRQGDGGEVHHALRERALSVGVLVSQLGATGLFLFTELLGFAAVPLPVLVQLLGAALAGAGLVLLWRVHQALGAHFSPVLELKADHQLVKAGPYATMRHPMYTAGLLFVVGHGVLAANLVVLLAPLAALGLLVALRLPDEERMLRERFGADFEQWAAETGALLPRLGGRS